MARADSTASPTVTDCRSSICVGDLPRASGSSASRARLCDQSWAITSAGTPTSARRRNATRPVRSRPIPHEMTTPPGPDRATAVTEAAQRSGHERSISAHSSGVAHRLVSTQRRRNSGSVASSRSTRSTTMPGGTTAGSGSGSMAPIVRRVTTVPIPWARNASHPTAVKRAGLSDRTIRPNVVVPPPASGSPPRSRTLRHPSHPRSLRMAPTVGWSKTSTRR